VSHYDRPIQSSVISIFAAALLATAATACSSSTQTGKHITAIATGTGYDAGAGSVTGKSDTFQKGQTVHVVMTVDTGQDGSATVLVHIAVGGTVEDTSLPLNIPKGKHVYDKTIMLRQAGKFDITADYNGANEAKTQISVE